jgi:hypothetical protein
MIHSRPKKGERDMKSLKLVAAVMLVFWTMSVAGGCGGGGAEIRTKTYTKTLGRELIDLHDSYSKGIITEKEYQKAKESLLEQRIK